MKTEPKNRLQPPKPPAGNALNKDFLTQEEVAARFQVEVRTVQRWQQDGFLPYLRLGHVIRYYWPDVVQHLVAHFTVCHLPKSTPSSSSSFSSSSSVNPERGTRNTELGGSQ